MSKNCGFSFFVGITAGALAGAATMLLLAPKSGEETRRDIKNKYGELNEKTKAELTKMKGKIDELSQKGKEKISKLKDKGLKQAEEMGETLSEVNDIGKKEE